MFSKLHVVLCSLVALLVTGAGITLYVGLGIGTATSPAEFNGPTYACDLGGGSRLEANRSSLSVKIGETFEISLKIAGPAADVSMPELTIINSNGIIVYGMTIWHSLGATELYHMPPPQEMEFNLQWKAKTDPMFNVEVTPGSYSFILKVENMDSGETMVSIRGTIEVK